MSGGVRGMIADARRRNEFETDPEYVEYTARCEGRAKPGETVFDFGGPEGPAATDQP